ncbi:response regulator [Candidatus Saccharibacteria bacterium]|nr:response regulator [Candidatus Saccharibacteria bacterium]
MIFIIDDDEIMAECVARAAGGTVKIFGNAIEAMSAIADGELPDLIFLDILLTGPDGFTFLNETISYKDTVEIPVVIVSSLDFGERDLSTYGVVGVLNKDKMRPDDVRKYVEEYAK